MGRPRKKSDATKFGRLLKRLGLDDAQAAEEIGITRQYASQLGCGQKVPSEALKERIAAWAKGRGARMPVRDWPERHLSDRRIPKVCGACGRPGHNARSHESGARDAEGRKVARA